MDTGTLVMEDIDAGLEFLKRLHVYQPVKAACWLRVTEDEERYLYASLEGLTDDNSDIAYGEVLRITGAMKDQYLDPFRVKLIRTSDPVAKAIMEIYQRFPGRAPTRFDGRVFAERAVAEVYLYPEFPTKP